MRRTERRDTAAGRTGRDPMPPNRARFVELRAAGETIEACCAAVGVDRATGYRWLRRADVRAALADAQAEGREVAAGILAGHAPRAAEVLGAALEDPDPHVRVRAACSVLDRVGLRGEAEATDDGEMALVIDGTIVFDGVTYVAQDGDGDKNGGNECESE